MVIASNIRHLAARVRRLAADRSGVAAVEFALLLPIMLGLYIGGLEFSDAYTIKRKLTNAANALGDLVTRTEEISTDEMDDILDAATAVITPYSAGNLKIKVSEVYIDEDSEATVTWSAARNDDCLAEGTTVTLPDGVVVPDSYLIVTEAHYNFDPSIGYAITGSIDINETFYLKARLGGRIPYDGVCD